MDFKSYKLKKKKTWLWAKSRWSEGSRNFDAVRSLERRTDFFEISLSSGIVDDLRVGASARGWALCLKIGHDVGDELVEKLDDGRRQGRVVVVRIFEALMHIEMCGEREAVCITQTSQFRIPPIIPENIPHGSSESAFWAAFSRISDEAVSVNISCV